MDDNLQILFFGLGSIGNKHWRLIKKDYPHRLYDVKELDIKSHSNIDLSHFDAAFICYPSDKHIEAAIYCIERGIKRLFIEKPVDISDKNLDTLLRLVKDNNVVTYIGYCLRFNHVISHFKSHLTGKETSTREIVCKTNSDNWPSQRELDHVLFELSHELDYAQYLFGPIQSIDGSTFDKYGKYTLTHEDSTQTHVELDLASSREIRLLRVAGITTHIKVTDLTYEDQLKYFFTNIDNTAMMNNIFEAEPLFRKIVGKVGE